MKKLFFFLTFLSILFAELQGQTINVSGFVMDRQNNRKLENAEITFTNDLDETISTSSDKFGQYSIALTKGKTYYIGVERTAYNTGFDTLSISKSSKDKLVKDLIVQRLAGYEFQADVKELLSGGNGIEKILGKELQNIKIEIFNNTSGKEVRVVEDDPKSTFEVNFERGNHYTILIRKKGFYAKRIEVNVDIYGCILCFEGLGNEYAPELESSTEDSERGILIGDIPMKRIVKNEIIRIDNIYYDYNKWNIRPDAKPALDDLVQTLKRNPITIELRSHTDSRGTDEYNMTLSEKRAESAVNYIISKGIKPSRLTSSGYGESMPLNDCIDGNTCDEAGYQFNRRTEFKVTGFLEKTNFDNKSLKEILEAEKLTKKRSIEEIDGI